MTEQARGLIERIENELIGIGDMKRAMQAKWINAELEQMGEPMEAVQDLIHVRMAA